MSVRSGDAHVWWLYLDADELVEGPGGRSVLEAVAGLDRSYRVVGAMGRRRANLDAIYREAFDEVDPFDMVGPGQQFDPQPAPPVC